VWQVWHWYVDFVVDLAFMIDFVLNLRTAYYDKVGPLFDTKRPLSDTV